MTESRNKLGNLPFPRSGILLLTRYGKVVATIFTAKKFQEFSGEDVRATDKGTVITKYGKPIIVVSGQFQVLAMEFQNAINQYDKKA